MRNTFRVVIGVIALGACGGDAPSTSGNEAGGAGGTAGGARAGAGGSARAGNGGAGSGQGGPAGAGVGGSVATAGGGAGGTAGVGGAPTAGAGGGAAAAGASGSSGSSGASGSGGVAGTQAGAPGSFVVYQTFPFDAAEAERRQQETAAATRLPVEYKLDLGGGVMHTMMLVPAGKAVLGEHNKVVSGEKEALHSFTALTPFYYGRTQLTRAEYRALMGQDAPVATGPDTVKIVNPTDAMPGLEVYPKVRDVVLAAFIRKLPAGWKARLPLSDEHEYAARAGSIGVWWNGDAESDLAAIGWYEGNSNGVLHEVAQKLANPWGFYDVVGNAWHWVCMKKDASCGDLLYGGYLVKGGAAYDEAFGNGCRTSNEQIRAPAAPMGYRFLVEPALPAASK